jgi:hypothetical protein
LEETGFGLRKKGVPEGALEIAEANILPTISFRNRKCVVKSRTEFLILVTVKCLSIGLQYSLWADRRKKNIFLRI